MKFTYFSKAQLLSYLNNPFVFELVSKVLNFNFENKAHTEKFMSLLKEHFQSSDEEPFKIQDFLKANNIGLCQEQGRVDGKILDLSEIIEEHFYPVPNTLLDIGVGNGNIITNVANQVGIDQENLYGIDVVDYSKNNNFNYITYDNEGKIPLADNSMDCVIIMMVLHHTNNPLDTLEEAYRVLKPNGKVIVRETNAYREELVEFNILMEYVFYTILLEIPIQITSNYFSDEKWEILFDKAGFEFYKISEKPLIENPFTGMYYLLTK